jgi:hypothetical protein
MNIVVSGAPFPRSRLHRFEPDWPPRFVVQNTDVGWNVCELCEKDHRLWMTDDSIWKRLPKKLRGLRICTKCFREHLPC